VPNSFDRSRLRLRSFREYLDDGWALIGTPAEVRDGLRQYRDVTGYERVLYGDGTIAAPPPREQPH